MNLRREPVAIAALVRSLLAVAIAFGVGLTGEQVASVVVAVELFAAIIVRDRVTPEPIIFPTPGE